MDIRLTQFSPGAGCGCKIAPKELEAILQGSLENVQTPAFEDLLVGHQSKDDAAVYDIGHGKAVVSTTDFFTPIVDDPFDFGRIAATNAISDIYAMGGQPLMAIAILGWPLDKLPASVAARVVNGARTVCASANIPLAGGHSINSTDPFFGLAVTGLIDVAHVKRNNSVQAGDTLWLTKPLGIGLISTGIKFGMATEAHQATALRLMTTLNNIGPQLAQIEGVHALTDVTGFGLMGHALEMVDNSPFTAQIALDRVPRIDGIDTLIEAQCIPGGTHRNYASYGHRLSWNPDTRTVTVNASGSSCAAKAVGSPCAANAVGSSCIMNDTDISRTSDNLNASDAHSTPSNTPSNTRQPLPDSIKFLLCDPQTSGGLLIAAAPEAAHQIQAICPQAVQIGCIA